MKLHLHHIELCTRVPNRVVELLEKKFRFHVTGYRNTELCDQTVLQSGETVFIVTYRKKEKLIQNNNNNKFLYGEPWTIFCCKEIINSNHIDSVFNIALSVEDLKSTLISLSNVRHNVIQGPVDVGTDVKYAIVSSICGDVVHTLIECKKSNWFLPGFTQINTNLKQIQDESTTHLDHVAYACHAGEINQIIHWYEQGFCMKRFITNRNETESDGLVIDDDVGMRLKVMEFWLCSEIGLSSSNSTGSNVFKLVVAESLPHVKNIQIEGFLRDHNGPGLQHIGLHTSNIIKTVEIMNKNGVLFRQPPPTYYTEVGQLDTIQRVGEDVSLLQKYGILLDNEADAFGNEDTENHNERYLMQIFTYPIFDRDTFFFEVIQRKGATGFGVGNVTALSRSIAAYEKQINENNNENQ